MSYSRETLVAALAERNVHVTKRTITNWIGRGLLPNLIARGRGRAGGVERRFPTDDVVEQALKIRSLLALRRTFEPALIALWLLGFDVAVDSVRNALLGSLTQFHKSIVGSPESDSAADDRIEDKILAPLEISFTRSPECPSGSDA